MPQRTKDGQELKVGDTVLIPAVVVGFDNGSKYHEIVLETGEERYTGEGPSELKLSARQIVTAKSMVPWTEEAELKAVTAGKLGPHARPAPVPHPTPGTPAKVVP